MQADEIRKRLLTMADPAYKTFNAGLIPGYDADRMIGIRAPQLRKLAKELAKDSPETCREFLDRLPHDYFEEQALHMLLLNLLTDYEEYRTRLWTFLPYVDNWSTNDIGANRKLVGKNKSKYLSEVEQMLSSDHPYILRFGILSLMTFYLEEHRLPDWCHRKTIQKAIESYRISPEQKLYLRSLR